MQTGPYELAEILGKGGMGTVYLGRHRETGQVVAVKVMAAVTAADPLLLKRFEQEYAAARRLRHPNIVQGLGFGMDGGQPYLVMEYVRGQNLAQWVRQNGPFPEAEAVRVARQLADALGAAHAERLIHRDVKPENVIRTPEGEVKLTDLGLIKDLGSAAGLTRTCTPLGTITYMAPEQFEDAKRADHRCDVYGLGATLYYLLTGAVPFPGRGHLTVLKNKLLGLFERPSHLAAGLNPDLERAICQALDPDPGNRPASCREFANLLASATGPALRPRVAPAEAAERPPQGAERRVARRFSCALDVRCRPLAGGQQRWPAAALDVSLTGIHLQLMRRFEVGSLLTVEVYGDDPAYTSTRLARVCWVRERPPGLWHLGCTFDHELSDEELSTFLDSGHRTDVIEGQAGA